jgi:carboxyl-terminal processing protease
MDKADKTSTLDTLIFDLRGNVGGAIDQLPYFLGPFIGPESYAYQFFHQGIKEDFKTKTGWLNSLVRYKKVIVLIDNEAQSTAEVTAAALKKYNVGLVLGTTTKGWGTVERVIPMDNQFSEKEKFSMFLVHRVTLRDDGQPIEGRGVDPQVSIKDPNWKKEVMTRFNDSELVKAIEEIYKK